MKIIKEPLSRSNLLTILSVRANIGDYAADLVLRNVSGSARIPGVGGLDA